MRLCAIAILLLSACGDDGNSAQIDARPAVDAAVDAPLGVDAMPARARRIFVSDNSDNQLAIVELGIDGTLTAMTNLDVALPDSPTSLAYARATSRLYVGLQGGGVATLDLDASLNPTLQGQTSPTLGNPVYIGLNADESVLVTAYFGDDMIQTHDASGNAPHPENATLATSARPHAALLGPGGRIYVPHRNNAGLIGTTQWFTINNDGDPVFAGELLAEAGVGPRHIAFTSDGAFAYIVNEMGNSVSAHSVGADGALTRLETVPALANPVAGDSGADIHVASDRFVYASLRGADELAMFSIGSDGRLTSLGNVATEARPREFDVSPDGRFVVACGQDNGFLQSYRVESNGALTSVDRLQVGTDLRWAIID